MSSAQPFSCHQAKFLVSKWSATHISEGLTGLVEETIKQNNINNEPPLKLRMVRETGANEITGSEEAIAFCFESTSFPRVFFLNAYFCMF